MSVRAVRACALRFLRRAVRCVTVQEERESRSPDADGGQDARGRDIRLDSFDNKDPETTNLYVGNLCPQISEELLYQQFAKYGAIQSVKIMWPTSRPTRSTTTCRWPP